MCDRRRLLDPVAQVEDVGPVAERVKDALYGVRQFLPAGDQGQRIEIALYRQSGRQFARRPRRIDRLVEADGIDSRSRRIGAKLAAGSLGKADDRRIGMTPLELVDDPGGSPDDVALELGRGQASGPAVEQ